MNVVRLLAVAVALAGTALSSTAFAGTVAIVTGSFYTSDLKNQLTAAGETVSEIGSYSAASLAGYDAVITYGNTNFNDFDALTAFATAGGRVILTPWQGFNTTVPAALQVFANGGSPQHNTSSPGMTVLNAGDSLLDNVTFPGVGTLQIGRINSIGFAAGVDQVVSWADGAAMVGHKAVGAGEVIGINLQVITSDTAYQAIDTAWATQLFVNAISPDAVPEPAMLGLFGMGAVALGFARRRRAA